MGSAQRLFERCWRPLIGSAGLGIPDRPARRRKDVAILQLVLEDVPANATAVGVPATCKIRDGD